MTHDERDRRDWPDEDGGPVADPQAGTPAPDTGDGPSERPSDETEAWSTADARADEPMPSEPAAEEPRAAWPTDAPEAGDERQEAWPTSPPERGETPILEPEPETEQKPPAAEAPPPEVEAYPAAAPSEPAEAPAAAHSVPAAESATGESTQCPRCGTENRPGLAFCRNCGQRLVAAGVAATVERPGAPEGSQSCPRCGTHNRMGVAFCQNCGANLRGTGPGYVPPSVAADEEPERDVAASGRAVLGPVVLLIGLVGLITGYLLPFAYGTGSLFERAWGSGGYGIAFWSGYPDVSGSLADQAYFGLAGPLPLLALLVLGLAVAGFARAVPGPVQVAGLVVALLWSIGLIVLFGVVELGANWDGDLVGLLRVLTPAGIILFLTSLIVVIGALTRFARS